MVTRLPKEVGAWLAPAAGEGEDGGLARPAQLGRDYLYPAPVPNLPCSAQGPVVFSPRDSSSFIPAPPTIQAQADASSQVDEPSSMPVRLRLMIGTNAAVQLGQTENIPMALSGCH